MEKNAKKLVASAEKLSGGKNISENYEALRALAQSEEVRKLVASISEDDIAGLSRAKGENAAELMRRLLSTPEGKELVRKVARATGV